MQLRQQAVENDDNIDEIEESKVNQQEPVSD